jgi:excisionase family DNA binding protein
VTALFPPATASGSQASLRLEEAAAILSVSTSTLRRWADTGRIATERTDGGHRRFRLSDVEELRTSLHGAGAEPRLLTPPLAPAPHAAELLASRGEAMAVAAARAVYRGSGQGWFTSEAATPHLRDWTDLVREALHGGDYACAWRATDRLMQRAERSGANLVQRHLFLERFCEVLVRSLSERQADPAAVTDVRRLFGHLAHRHLDAHSR